MKTNLTLVGDCREMLKEIPDNFVQTCITSPPYWGLRDYGTAEWEGGDENCDHKIGRETRGGLSDKQKTTKGSFGDEAIKNNQRCPKCGAIRKDSQLGLEETPEEYVESMVAVFREVKRVLREDGTLWLNLGDSYATSHSTGTKDDDTGWKHGELSQGYQARAGGAGHGTLKAKDLVGIPWRVAFALRDELGFYLRQDIIWNKRNPMPESVKDRCTKSHEYIFLFSKNRQYYFDHEAIKEPSTEATKKRYESGWKGNEERDYVGGKQNHFSKYIGTEKSRMDAIAGRNKRSVWTVNTKPYKDAHFAVFPPELITPCILAGSSQTACADCGKPYERQVETIRIPRWELPPDDPRYRPRKYETEYDKLNGDARFNVTMTIDKSKQKPYAVIDPEHRNPLIEYRELPNHDELRTYLQTARKKKKITIQEIEDHFGTQAPHHWFEKGGSYPDKDDWIKLSALLDLDNTYQVAMTEIFYKSGMKGETQYADTGFTKQCQCETNETVGSVVLDPFMGSGTTAETAQHLGRRWLGCELNEEYLDMQKKRTAQQSLL